MLPDVLKRLEDRADPRGVRELRSARRSTSDAGEQLPPLPAAAKQRSLRLSAGGRRRVAGLTDESSPALTETKWNSFRGLTCVWCCHSAGFDWWLVTGWPILTSDLWSRHFSGRNVVKISRRLWKRSDLQLIRRQQPSSPSAKVTSNPLRHILTFQQVAFTTPTALKLPPSDWLICYLHQKSSNRTFLPSKATGECI